MKNCIIRPYDYSSVSLYRTSKKMQLVPTTTINWLTLFEEIIAVYTENHTKHINTKFNFTGTYSYHWVLKGQCISNGMSYLRRSTKVYKIIFTPQAISVSLSGTYISALKPAYFEHLTLFTY
jgi:hypothetical protein